MSKRTFLVVLAVVVVWAGVVAVTGGFDNPLCQSGRDERPKDAPPPPPPGEAGVPNLDVDVWVVGADGSNPRPLGVEFPTEFVSWSSDRTRIVYAHGEGSLVVANADGTGARTVFEAGRPSSLGAYAGGPTWSPDGRKIAFASKGVQVIGADGSDRTKLTVNDGPDTDSAGQPAWSPDGSKIAFTREESIEIMNVDGSNPRLVTRQRNFRLGEVSWSPDGKYIAFAARGGYYGTWIGVVRPDGSGLRRIARHCSGGHPAWSLDARKIAFSGPHGLMIMGADGSNLKRIPNTWDGGHPSWSLDGKTITFFRN